MGRSVGIEGSEIGRLCRRGELTAAGRREDWKTLGNPRGLARGGGEEVPPPRPALLCFLVR